MKKSQIQTQIFVYVLALVVVSLIMLYGYDSIKKIRAHTSTVEHIQLKTDLENTIKRVAFDYGSVEKLSFDVPSAYGQLCFVDVDQNPSIPQAQYPIINNSVESGVEDNVFLVSNVAEDSFYVGGIEVIPDGFHCFNVTRGKMNVRLEALGEEVRISEWNT